MTTYDELSYIHFALHHLVKKTHQMVRREAEDRIKWAKKIDQEVRNLPAIPTDYKKRQVGCYTVHTQC